MFFNHRVYWTVIVLGAFAFASWPQLQVRAANPAEADAASTAEHSGAAHEHRELGDPENSKGPMEWQTDMAVYTFLVFLVLAAILGKFAWKPIVAGLEKREQGIADNIAAAQRAHDEAKQVLADYEKRLAAAADQVRQMYDEARRDAEKSKAEIIAEARAAAQLEQDRVLREVHRATDQALKQISERSANLAIDLAGRIVKSKLNPADHTRLVQEAMADFASGNPSVN